MDLWLCCDQCRRLDGWIGGSGFIAIMHRVGNIRSGRYSAPFYSKPQVDRVVKNSADHEDEAVILCQDVWEKMQGAKQRFPQLGTQGKKA